MQALTENIRPLRAAPRRWLSRLVRPSSLTLSEPRWEKSVSGASPNRICEIRGLKSSYSRQPCAYVDAGIADLVLAMNAAGLATEYCCSALAEDHRNDRWLCSGYISFARPLPDELAGLIDEYMDGDACIRIQLVSNDQMKAAWSLVRSAFHAWSNGGDEPRRDNP